MHIHVLMSCVDEYTKNNFSLIRSKIHELHPVHRASLEILLRHLLRILRHSDKNGVTVEELSTRFCHYVLGGYGFWDRDINLKVRCIDLLCSLSDTLKEVDDGGSYSKCICPVRRPPLSVSTCPLHCRRDRFYPHIWSQLVVFESRVATVC